MCILWNPAARTGSDPVRLLDGVDATPVERSAPRTWGVLFGIPTVTAVAAVLTGPAVRLKAQAGRCMLPRLKMQSRQVDHSNAAALGSIVAAAGLAAPTELPSTYMLYLLVRVLATRLLCGV